MHVRKEKETSRQSIDIFLIILIHQPYLPGQIFLEKQIFFMTSDSETDWRDMSNVNEKAGQITLNMDVAHTLSVL